MSGAMVVRAVGWLIFRVRVSCSSSTLEEPAARQHSMSLPTQFRGANPSLAPAPSTPPSSQISSTDTPSSMPSSAAQSSSPVVATTTFVDSLPEDQTKAPFLVGTSHWERHALKRPFNFTLPSDQGPHRPKRAKKVLTTVSLHIHLF